MKTLTKLTINSDKILKDEELKSLYGGEWCGICDVSCPSGPTYTMYVCDDTYDDVIKHMTQIMQGTSCTWACYG